MRVQTRVDKSTSVQVYGSVSVRICVRARRRRDDDEMTGETTMCDDSTTGSTMTMMAGCGGGDDTRVYKHECETILTTKG
jgi:hypothetical protein